MKKILAIGIVFLFIGSGIPALAQSTPKSSERNQHTYGQVIFTIFPENGKYWNDRKIADYTVPLFIHYHFKLIMSGKMGIKVFTNDTNVDRVEYWIGPYLQFIQVVIPGPVSAYWGLTYGLFPHSQSLSLTAKIFWLDGHNESASISVFREFL
jgi:hypothetical protein